MDWQDSLKQFLDANPELPQGSEPVPDAEPKRVMPVLRIDLDRKRAGKTATIISGFDDDEEARRIAALLKSRLASGGSTRGGEILIQGDKMAAVRDFLKAQGYKVKG